MAMNLFSQGLLDAPLGLFAALLIGVGFGFWLERAGFGSSRKLTAIFYLQDFAVLKVMFSAMATAAIVLHGLAALGRIDLHDVYVPETVLWPQLAGGLLFGVGFVAGGWCPGTAAVGLASGKLDALVFLVGAGGGSLVFAALQPQFGDFLQAGAMGVCAVPERLGIRPLLGAVALLAIALAAFAAVNRLERSRRQA
jgi:uncharacterized membrane protein YedE/YeeE